MSAILSHKAKLLTFLISFNCTFMIYTEYLLIHNILSNLYLPTRKLIFRFCSSLRCFRGCVKFNICHSFSQISWFMTVWGLKPDQFVGRGGMLLCWRFAVGFLAAQKLRNESFLSKRGGVASTNAPASFAAPVRQLEERRGLSFSRSHFPELRRPVAAERSYSKRSPVLA